MNRYRIRYYWRKLWTFFGLCPDCHSPLNATRYGRKHCPECGTFK